MNGQPTAPTLSRMRLRVFLDGQAVSLLGDGFALLAVPLVVLAMSHSALATALSAVPRTVGYLFVGLIAGVVVDRADPRRVMLVADTVRLSAFAVITILSATGSTDVVAVLICAFIASSAGAFFECALSVAVKDAVPAARLVSANSYLETASQISLVAGPAAVGAFTAVIGLTGALVINTTTFVVSLATLAFLPARTAPSARPSEPSEPCEPSGRLRQVVQDSRTGLAFIRRNRQLGAITALQGAVNFVLGVETLIVFFGRETLHLSQSLCGIAVAAAGIGGIVGASVSPLIARKVSESTVILLSVLAMGACVIGIGAARSVWLLGAANLVLGLTATCATVVIRTLRQRVTPRELLGRVTGAARVISLAVNPLGAALAGAAVTWLHGPRTLFLGAGLLLILIAGSAWRVAATSADDHLAPDPGTADPSGSGEQDRQPLLGTT
ncbi:MFS transporter [Streptacidiphilus pinicola]|nr:MFS transporter [Streptacidiphilus pinicola]